MAPGPRAARLLFYAPVPQPPAGRKPALILPLCVSVQTTDCDGALESASQGAHVRDRAGVRAHTRAQLDKCARALNVAPRTHPSPPLG